jgi:hypothetical protein
MAMQVSLTEVPNREPLLVVDQREKAPSRRDHFSAEDGEANHSSGVGRTNGRVVKMPLGDP